MEGIVTSEHQKFQQMQSDEQIRATSLLINDQFSFLEDNSLAEDGNESSTSKCHIDSPDLIDTDCKDAKHCCKFDNENSSNNNGSSIENLTVESRISIVCNEINGCVQSVESDFTVIPDKLNCINKTKMDGTLDKEISLMTTDNFNLCDSVISDQPVDTNKVEEIQGVRSTNLGADEQDPSPENSQLHVPSPENNLLVEYSPESSQLVESSPENVQLMEPSLDNNQLIDSSHENSQLVKHSPENSQLHESSPDNKQLVETSSENNQLVENLQDPTTKMDELVISHNDNCDKEIDGDSKEIHDGANLRRKPSSNLQIVNHANLESGEDDDEDAGVYDISFRSSKWIFVKDDETTEDLNDETNDGSSREDTVSNASTSSNDQESDAPGKVNRADSVSTTVSEVEYRRAYREVSVKRVQRQSNEQTFVRENTSSVSADKTVILSRNKEGEGLGFSVIGNHPTTVSTVVPNGIADKAGVEVGDVILAINFDGVLHKNQIEIVAALQEAGEVIKLELCRQSSLRSMGVNPGEDSSEIYSAYMSKLTNSVLNMWKKRWFVLKTDNCLYYYKNKEDKDILGAIPLAGYMIQRATDLKRSRCHSMKLMHRAKTYYFAAENETEYAQWAKLLNNATTNQSNMESWLDSSAHNVGLPALSIRDADCFGYLFKTGWRHKSWKRRYAVLKDGCLYYYCNIDSPSAQGVAHLHGYIVEPNPQSTKKNAFDLVPPDRKMRTFHFYVENKVDKERWIRAMKVSISRWVKVQ